MPGLLAPGSDLQNPNVVLGLFTWSDDPAYDNREIDIEFSRWNNALGSSNTQYTVQPYTNSSNVMRWALQPGYSASSHSWRWTSRSIAFLSSAFGNSLAQWSYTRRNGVPKPGGETPRINLWLSRGAPPSNGLPVEVIISKFEFVP